MDNFDGSLFFFFVDWKRASRAFMVLSCLTFVVAILYVLMLQIKPRLPSILLAFILTISCEFNSIFQKFPLSLLLHPSYFLRHSLLICLDLIFYDTITFVIIVSLCFAVMCALTGVAVYTARSGILQVPGLEFGFSYMLVWGGIGMNTFGVLLSCCDQAGYHFF